MKTLIIFHDPDCGLCANFKDWMLRQTSYPKLLFIPYQSEQARQYFPDIDRLEPGREIVVMANDGRWWQGPPAWLTCLWALKRYRKWSYRLAAPTLLPLVAQFCHLLSQNRLHLSQLLKLNNAELAQLTDQGTSLSPCD